MLGPERVPNTPESPVGPLAGRFTVSKALHQLVIVATNAGPLVFAAVCSRPSTASSQLRDSLHEHEQVYLTVADSRASKFHAQDECTKNMPLGITEFGPDLYLSNQGLQQLEMSTKIDLTFLKKKHQKSATCSSWDLGD